MTVLLAFEIYMHLLVLDHGAQGSSVSWALHARGDTRACRASTAVYLLLGWLWGLCRSSVAWELLHDFTTLRRFLTQSGVGVKGFRLMYRESLCELYCNTGYAALLLIVRVSEWRAVLDSARLLRSLA